MDARALLARRTRAVLLVALATLAAGTFGCGGGGDGGPPPPRVRALAPGDGIAVGQMTFRYPNAPHPYTTWGRLEIDPAALEKERGIRGGRINVTRGQAWVAVNVPVLDPADGPYAVHFDLGTPAGTPLQGISLQVLHSDRGIGAIAPFVDAPEMWPVEEFIEDASGIDVPTDPGPPPASLTIADRLADLLPAVTWTQAITNEQCAHNQCFPMALANALAYLDDMGVLTVPHVHAPGLGGDATLVGRLDTECGRTFASRASGNGVWFDPMLDGTFAYLSDEGLTGILAWRHQGRGYGDPGEAVPNGDYTAWGSTSIDDGVVMRFGWILDRVADGCGVVAAYRYDSGGGHAVRVTGAGRGDDGRPWIRYTHDAQQTSSDATDTRGLESVVIPLQDTDGDGRYNFGSPTRELTFLWAACP